MSRPAGLVILTFVLVVVTWSAVGQEPATQKPAQPEVYRKVDPGGLDVQAAVKAAVEEQRKKTGQEVALVSIVKAERRTITPDNFRVCLSADRSGVTERAQVTIARDDKQKKWNVTVWSWGSCR